MTNWDFISPWLLYSWNLQFFNFCGGMEGSAGNPHFSNSWIGLMKVSELQFYPISCGKATLVTLHPEKSSFVGGNKQ